MYAVVKTGGKQYRVAKNDLIRIERLPGEAGDIVTLGEVLLLADETSVSIGAPFVEGAAVAGEIVEQTRAEKIVVFKKRRRKNYRRKKGHRQLVTVLKITDILTDGRKPVAAKKPRKAPTAAEAAEARAAPETGPAVKDDVLLIGGVGPKMKEKLAGYGIVSLKQLAAMSEADLAKMDEALGLHGRATREAWVDQAKDLLAGKEPRAKADRE
jgi:large subunit ribosomal protein L21